MISMKTFAATFSETSVRHAVAAVMWDTHRKGTQRFLAVLGLIALAPLVALTFEIITPGATFGALTGVVCAFLIYAIVLASSYWQNVQYAIHEFRRNNSDVGVEFSDAGCKVTCGTVSGFLPWGAFVRSTRYYYLWLVQFDAGSNQNSQEAVRESALDLHFKEGKASPLGFPIFCILPLRRYPTVVLPLIEISASEVSSALNDAIDASRGNNRNSSRII